MSLTVDFKKSFETFSLDVSFTAKDEVLALLGSSGCGKSTTLKCIAGIFEPDEGHIELNGKVFFDSASHINIPPQEREIGFLFQNYALFPNMTVEKNIMSGMKDKSMPHKMKKTSDILRSFKLENESKKYPSQLSGGQQQRTALARILVTNPKLLLLDEPFSALDSYLKWQLENELNDILREFRGTVIWVSHDRNEVYRNCSRVCIMENGKSHPLLTTDDMVNSPGNISAAMLSGCKNIIRASAFNQETNCIYIPEWHVVLRANSVNKNICAVGIRAHYITPVEPSSQNDDNVLTCTVVRAVKDIFSTIYSLRIKGSDIQAPLLRMELPRGGAAEAPEFHMDDELYIKIEPESIMQLT